MQLLQLKTARKTLRQEVKLEQRNKGMNFKVKQEIQKVQMVETEGQIVTTHTSLLFIILKLATYCITVKLFVLYKTLKP